MKNGFDPIKTPKQNYKSAVRELEETLSKRRSYDDPIEIIQAQEITNQKILFCFKKLATLTEAINATDRDN